MMKELEAYRRHEQKVNLQAQFEKVPDVHKIAVLRANGLGDFIFALPALEALHNAYPQAEIVLLAKDWHVAFLKGRPGPVDRVIAIPPSKGVNEEPGVAEDSTELKHFFESMRQEHFDLAIQMHGGGHYSNPFTLRLGARVTVGLKTPDAAPLDRWIPYIYFQSEPLRYLEVASLVGATATGLEPHIPLVEEDIIEAQKVIPVEEQPLVALHPGAGDSQRCWPPEKFAAVGDALAATGACVLVIGTKEECELCDAVVSTMEAGARNLCGCLALGGLAGLLSRCRVLVSNDSGPMHLAAAVGTATVGIYWCFNLMTAGILTRLHHRPIVSWRLECPVCGINRSHGPCEHRASFVAGIPPEEVIVAALDLFSSASVSENGYLTSNAPGAIINAPSKETWTRME